MSYFSRALTWFFVCSPLLACSPPAPSTDAQDTGSDATRDTAGDSEVPPCPNDEACNDHVFCNGLERCTATGCRSPSPATPCSAGEMCNEAMQRCDSVCPDMDTDGHRAAACGGDDCDDTDATASRAIQSAATRSGTTKTATR
jgi:hypothetical protein